MNESLTQDIKTYKEHMDLGAIPAAYKGLIDYTMSVRTHFVKNGKDVYTVGSFYQGYMDMSYFPITPTAWKGKKLKIGVVLNHEKVRFELWLLGHNKEMHQHYWKILKAKAFDKYPLSPNAQNSVIEHVLIANPDFTEINDLTTSIEKGTLKFIQDITAAIN